MVPSDKEAYATIHALRSTQNLDNHILQGADWSVGGAFIHYLLSETQPGLEQLTARS